MFRSVKLTLASLSLLAAGSAFGQAIVLKDGSSIPKADFALENGNIVRTIRIGDKSATTILPKKNIATLDWPQPMELNDAKALMSQGKSAEAIALLKTSVDFFAQLQDIPGNWYKDVLFAYIEALSQGGKFEETVKLIPQVKLLPLSDEQKLQLKIISLDIERQTTSDFLTIRAQAENILSETDDSSVGAAIWTILADVHARKKEWEQALMAYLRVPVFYGTQMQRVPDAELNAARMLVKMKRYEDATALFTRITESYNGSAVAETANKEKAAINGLKNEKEGAPEGEAPKEGEKPKENSPTQS